MERCPSPAEGARLELVCRGTTSTVGSNPTLSANKFQEKILYRIGVDVGGTHTDGVVIKENSILKKSKVLTNHSNLEYSITKIIDILTEGIKPSDIKNITLSTTLNTNMILEKKLPPTGLILSGGPGINIENFKKGEFSYIVQGIIDHRGRVLKTVNLHELEPIIDELLTNNIDAVAVCTKFSVRNPVHEKLIKERLAAKFLNVTTGHSLSGNLNFPRRINTAFLNAALYKKNNEFIEHIISFLEKNNFSCPVYILKADGGTISTNEAKEKPIQTVHSGSAAGIIGIMSLLNIEEEGAFVIDIGGTSSDFAIFYNNEPLFEPEGIKIKDEPTLVRAIYSHSLGLGGDSSIKTISGKIEIGPEREDVAIAFGGTVLTPTDVVFYYEKIDNENMDKIENEIGKIAEKLNLSNIEVCEEILKVFSEKIQRFMNDLLEDVNSKPIYTIKELVGYKDIKISKMYLMGAPAENFKNFLSKYLDFEIDVIPEYEVVNAIGAAVSRNTKEMTLFADTSVLKVSIPEIDYFEKITDTFSKEDCYEILKEQFENKEFEITEEMIFNIISGFYRAGKTYRIKAQIKPGVEISLN